MISLLIPTRKRRAWFERTIQSASNTAANPKSLEFVAYVDEDDARTYENLTGVRFVIGPRIVLSDTWNKCFAAAKGDILFQGNDDIIFRTSGWDQMVEEEFAKYSDKILMVHGDALAGNRETFGPHPFVHRHWIEIVGYLTPPHYVSDFGDTFLNDVANALGRRKFLPFIVEHMHYIWGKAEVDQTTSERLQRHQNENPQALYESHAPERAAIIERLRAAMT